MKRKTLTKKAGCFRSRLYRRDGKSGRVPVAVRAPRRSHKHHMNTIIGTGRMSMQGEPDTDSPALSA